MKEAEAGRFVHSAECMQRRRRRVPEVGKLFLCSFRSMHKQYVRTVLHKRVNNENGGPETPSLLIIISIPLPTNERM